jgi:hypothetical protein
MTIESNSASMQTCARKFCCIFKGPSCYSLLFCPRGAPHLIYLFGEIGKSGCARRRGACFFLLFTGTPPMPDFAHLPAREARKDQSGTRMQQKSRLIALGAEA